MHGHDIIVVGASLGGFETLRALARGLPPELPAAVFVVLHTAPDSAGTFGDILDRSGPLPARPAEDGEHIHPGTIYVAPPDRHMMVQGEVVRLSRGPRENRSRPAIDPLFRSAAVAYRSRVVGVILSGTQDDGSAGLRAVKRCGGISVVQDPADAAFPEMPRHALEAAEADHVVPLSKMGALLEDLAGQPAPHRPEVPQDLLVEMRLTLPTMTDTAKLDQIAERASLSCPSCGGVLWQMNDVSMKRYRCHIGHAFTSSTLLEEQVHETEQALMVALRTMEDRIKLLERMAGDDGRTGRGFGSGYRSQADELQRHAERLREILLQRHASSTQQTTSDR